MAELALDGDRPTLKVRQGKGGKDRVVPVHPELKAGLHNFLASSNVRRGRIFDASWSTAWRWLKQALARAVELGLGTPGRPGQSVNPIVGAQDLASDD